MLPVTAKHRDLSLTTLPQGTLVTACDSCGAVGEKPGDVLRVPARFTGRFTARVALMEVLAFGAEVVTAIDAVACEMEPTGREIIRGIRDELESAGVDPAVLTGSTEENFPTSMTALGMTVVGWKERQEGRPLWEPSRPGDRVVCIGLPQVGAEVQLDHNTAMVSYADLRRFRTLPGLREIVPVGSHGICWEAEQLAAYNGLTFVPEPHPELDVHKSAGPATCAIAVLSPEAAAEALTLPRVRQAGYLQ